MNWKGTEMSEQGAKPEVLPGDLITQPGLYESRGGDIVQITGWDDGWWVSEWHGTVDWYGSDGRQRFRGALDTGRWDLLHWVRPLPANEVEPETTSEQLAEIEGQGEPVQVRAGRWRTRGGDIRNVTPTPEGDGREQRFPWWDAQYRQTWTSDGRYYLNKANQRDLIEYLGPLESEPQSEPQPEPEPVPPAEPIQVREGRWKTRGGKIVQVVPTDEARERDRNNGWLWMGAAASESDYWHADGTWLPARAPHDNDLVEYLGPIEPEIGWQAEAIGRLQGEAHVLNMEIGGLERQLMQRDARIRDLETLHAAAAQAVVDAGKENDALRLQVQNRQNKCEQQKGRIGFLETLTAGNGAAISDYTAKVEKLQGLVDTARGQLEAAATERDELRAAIDAADKQLDQKDAQIRDLRIELDAAQQVPRPVSDEGRGGTYRRRIEPQQPSDSESDIVEDLRTRLDEYEVLLDEAERSGQQVNAELQQLRDQVLALTLERDRYQSWLKDHHKAGQQAIVEALQTWLRPVLELVAEHPEEASPLAVAVLGYLPGIASRLIEE